MPAQLPEASRREPIHVPGEKSWRIQMIRRIVSQRELDKEPFQLWNAFVNLLATEAYSDLTIEQRPAHLVFWYESEVQNGGHLQYFENQTIEKCLRIDETIAALGKLGANCQLAVLRDASCVW
jgi:hypothetical protein